jgi:hypothetical protein
MFTDEIQKFDNVLHEGQIYLVSHSIIELSNPKYVLVQNEFCLIFNENTKLIPVNEEDLSILTIKQNQICTYVPLLKILEMQKFP